MLTPDSPSDLQLAKELSPRALAAARWLRYVARSLRVMRLYRDENEVTDNAKSIIAAQLDELLENGSLEFRIGSNEITLEGEPVVRVQKRKAGQDILHSPEEDLPFFIYQDGIRLLRILPKVPRKETDTLIEALRQRGRGPDTENDLVTMLWQANLTFIQAESVPLEQTIYLSSRRASGEGGGGSRGHAFAWSPAGEEIRADLGQAAGPQGLHRDTFDDWELPAETMDVPEAYMALLPDMESARAQFQIDWVQEWMADWNTDAPGVLREVLAQDPGIPTRRALTHFVVTWLVNTFQRRDWIEAQRALELLREFDPERAVSDPPLEAAMSEIDAEPLAEQLDTADGDEQGRFLGLTVAIGKPALRLAFDIMAHARRGRLRAAACTALAYLCDDDPSLLEPWLTDMRWYVVRNVVFILGQIGGSRVGPMLRTAAHHPDVRVRRGVVHALAAVQLAERMPILMSMLDTPDPQLLSAVLSLMIREPRREVAQELLRRISAPDFDSRHEEAQRALMLALGEIANDDIVDGLAELLNGGGWFARVTTRRLGVARMLQRIGTEKALAVLDDGLRSKSEAVRTAVLEAVGARSVA
jgi:HEAT repeat protein